MIPKIIHYCWLGKKSLPPLAKKCLKSWQKFCPDYEIKFWNEDNYDFQKNNFMQNAYRQKAYAFVPDYARLEIIYNYGGIYLDTDVELLKSFDEFLKYPAFCGFESEHFINFGHGFGAQKGNPVIKQLMQPYETLDFKLSDKILEQASFYSKNQAQEWQKKGLVPSPLLQTQILIQNFGLKQNNTRQSLKDMEVFPSTYFCPRDKYYTPIKTKQAYSVHHYMASWLPASLKTKIKFVRFLRKYLGNKTVDFLFEIKRKITRLLEKRS